MTPADAIRQEVVGHVALSPDGETVIYSLRRVEASRDTIDLWAMPYAGGQGRRLTEGDSRDYHPRISPDGLRLGFISKTPTNPPQLMVRSLEGGPAACVTAFKRGVLDFDWSWESEGLVVLAADEFSPALAGGTEPDTATAYVVREPGWRLDGAGLLLYPSHIHLIRLPERHGELSASIERLTDGPWSARRPRCSPDGRCVAFLADLAEKGNGVHNPQVHMKDLESREMRQATNLGPIARFAFDPDGSLICLAYAVPIPADGDAPMLWRVGTKGTQLLSKGLDRVIGTSGHLSDLHDWQLYDFWGEGCDDAGRTTCVHDRGRNVPYHFGDEGWEELVEPGLNPVAHHIAGNGRRTVAVMCLGTSAPEVYAVSEGAPPRRLTECGNTWLRGIQLPDVREVFAEGPAGPIQAFVVSPPGATAGALPTVLEMHGGPTSAWAVTPPLDALILASAGYRVVLPNVRGSYHCGRDWVTALGSDICGADVEDCHAVLDSIVDQGLADPSRLGCLGLSHGGLLVNWLLATSDRFAAGVSENGVANNVSSWGMSDLGPSYYTALGFREPFTPEGAQRLWDVSPLRLAASIRAPLLMLQGEDDLRDPAADNEQLFVALRRLQREVEYVVYPQASHMMRGTARPDQRMDRLTRVLAWFQRWMPSGT